MILAGYFLSLRVGDQALVQMAARPGDLERVPVGRRADTRLRDIVRSRRGQPLLTRREALLTKIAGQLRQRGGIAIVVDDDNRPIGVLTSDDLARVARSSERDGRKSASLSI